MHDEFGECYPLHLGVTEAGDGEDGRIKSAAGIGTLLEDGIGDTIRVSLTEDPEFEIPVCRDIVKRYERREGKLAVDSLQEEVRNLSNVGDEKLIIDENVAPIPEVEKLPYNPFEYKRRETFSVGNIGGHHVPVVVADLSKMQKLMPEDLRSVGYTYHAATDKWTISDTAADYIFTGHTILPFALPGTLKVIVYPAAWEAAADKTKYFPLYDDMGYARSGRKSRDMNFVMIDCYDRVSGIPQLEDIEYLERSANDKTVVYCLSSRNKQSMAAVRRMFIELMNRDIHNPAIIMVDSFWHEADEHLIHYATESGALLLDGMGDGVCFGMTAESYRQTSMISTSGRNYLSAHTTEQFINNTAFSILQATRTRVSKTEYISCPSCGRTLFDLQETTARIRAVTNHLKGVKIAIMGCIVNGPGEMADADFGYVGSGPGKITLYKGKEIVKRNVNSEVAVEELVSLLKENGAWVEKTSAAVLL
jgi:(E)-4-hydroxy-3-methylbut-2-enyl-diphosphate synthase